MASSQKKFEFILSVKDKGFNSFKTARTGMAAFNKEVKSGSSGLKMLTSDIGLLTSSLLGFAGVIGGGLALSNLVTGVVAAEREVDNMARTAGQSAGDFQAYAYGVQSVGIAADKLADISKDVKDKIGDYLETGGGEFADFMENIAAKTGIAAEELIKMSGPDALIAVKKAMDDAGVSAEKQIFYLEALGNDASLLIPLLENEGEAWKKLAADAREMGVAISDLDHKQLLDLAKSLDELQLNLGVVKREIVLALAPVIKDLAAYFAENREELKEFVVGLAESGVELVQFVRENGELIVTLGKVTAAILVVTKVGGALVTLFNGIRAASLAMTGTNLVGWLASVATGLRAVNLAAATTPTTLGAVAGGLGAYLVGMSIGSKIDEWEYFRDVTQANAKALEEVPEKLAAISKETGVVIRSFDDLDRAQKDGLISYDEEAGKWVKAHADAAKAAGTSAATQRTVTKAALDEMKKQYKSYGDTVAKIMADIAGRQLSLAEQLRAMGRTSMTDSAAWKDLKKEAMEYAEAAAQARIEATNAFSAGDTATGTSKLQEAVSLYDKAREKAAQLNTEVKDGENVVKTQAAANKTAMDLVKKYGEAAIEVQQNLKKEVSAAAQALNAQSGGKLAEDMPEIAKQFDSVAKKADTLAEKSGLFSAQWNDAWHQFLQDGSGAVADLERQLGDLVGADYIINVKAQLVSEKATGGLAGVVPGFAVGGTPAYFPRLASPLITAGSGLRDDVPAMLKRFEFIQPEESVKYYGVGFMEAIRRRRLPKPMGFAQGGTPAGPVSFAGSGVTMNNSFHFSGDVQPMARQTARQNARMILTEVEKMWNEGAR